MNIIVLQQLQDGRTPLDIAKGDEVIEAFKKQQMKVHETNNDNYR